ncbi:ribonuclease Y [Candidatus Dojkabacteria bacterium]|nr:ribonuclease Y [Candidatus Dojkabacteria bacterium]
METLIIVVLSIISTVGIGGSVVGFLLRKDLAGKLKDRENKIIPEDEALEKASVRAKEIILEAQREALDVKSKTDEKVKSLYRDLEENEKRLDIREKKIIERANSIDHRFDEIGRKEKAIEQAKIDVKKLRDKTETELQQIAGLTKAKAKEQLEKKLEEDMKEYIAKKIKEAEYKIESEAEERAKEILVDSMQKSATDYVAETTTTSVEVNEDQKGKIIGKEGRNIRTFERLTGVDIIVDEAPGQISVSSFDPIRREVAAIALKGLLKDGRIHPGTIEESIKKAKEEVVKEIRKTGEYIAYETGFNDLPLEVVKLLGRFKYRFSYGQNLIKHTIEMVNIGAQLAAEIGADVQLTKKACLLHDIGKVLTHEIEGKPHHHISGNIIRKYFKDEKLANAAEAHHGDIEAKSTEAHLVAIADAISGARPGARVDNYEDYIKRIKALEDIAKQYKEVKEAYAIHAGREVRVLIDPKVADDEEAKILAHKIAKEIEETQNYPGIVKITAIREFRIEEEAK